MEIRLRPLHPNDAADVAGIFNHYVENGYAAYPEQPLPAPFFLRMLEEIGALPALAAESAGELLGFAFLRPHSKIPTFARTVEIACFVRPDHLGVGIGKTLYDQLFMAARVKGVARVLANICAINTQSIGFHTAMGFKECGRFKGVLEKHGRILDVVWMERGL